MKRILMVLLMITTLVFAGCTPQETPVEPTTEETPAEAAEVEAPDQPPVQAYYPLQITDSYDRVVTIESAPQKVISIAPSITETIYALGKGDLLVGRTDYDDYPVEIFDVASVGSLSDPNIETITEIDPDLIIASTHFSEDTLTNLENLGYTVLVLYGPNSFEGAYETISKVAQVLNASENGDMIVTEMKATVDTVIAAVENLDKPSIYYVIGFGEYGDYTATGETFLSQMIDMAGGNNIAKDAEGWSYSLETLVENDPDIIICSQYFDTKAAFESTDIYKDLSAVANGQLHEIDNNKLDRQGPRVADGLMDLAKLIHPDAFN